MAFVFTCLSEYRPTIRSGGPDVPSSGSACLTRADGTVVVHFQLIDKLNFYEMQRNLGSADLKAWLVINDYIFVTIVLMAIKESNKCKNYGTICCSGSVISHHFLCDGPNAIIGHTTMDVYPPERILCSHYSSESSANF